MTRNRIRWIDYAKGISIILVVLHHSISRNPEFVFYDPALIYINDTLKLFRMPLFFFVSGLFLYKTLERSLETVLKSRIATLVYLFALWGVIRYLFETVAPYFLLGNERSAEDFKSILFHFIDPYQFWFLYALAIYFLITRIAKKHLTLTFLASLILFTVSVQKGNHHTPTFFDELTRYFPMFLLGYFTSDLIRTFANKVRGYHSLIAIPYFIITGIILNSNLASSSILIFILMCAGILVGVTLSVTLTKIPIFSWLDHIGKRTLPIYLMHWIPILVLTRTLPSLLPNTFTYVFVVILFVSGVLFPLIAYPVLYRFKMDYLFEYPKLNIKFNNKVKSKAS